MTQRFCVVYIFNQESCDAGETNYEIRRHFYCNLIGFGFLIFSRE